MVFARRKRKRGPNSAQLRDAIDRGRTGSKVPFPDPAAAPLGTDDEAGGMPPTDEEVRMAMSHELKNSAAHHRIDSQDSGRRTDTKPVR